MHDIASYLLCHPATALDKQDGRLWHRRLFHVIVYDQASTAGTQVRCAFIVHLHSL